MPPLSIQSTRDAGTNVSDSVEPFYTDEDLLILHDIVVYAQQILPKLPARERLPTNALFKAYNHTLPRLGIDADHDNRYARILFRIGGLRGFNGTLFEKFEEILAQRGITLEYDGDDYDHLRSSKTTSQDNAENIAESETISQDENQLPQLPRRNSESTAWDVENAAQAAHSKPQRRNRSASPLRQATPGRINGMRSFVSQATRAISPEPLPEPPQTTQKNREERAAHNVRTWLEANHDESESASRYGGSISTYGNGSIRIHRDPDNASPRGRRTIRNLSFADTNGSLDRTEDIAVTSSSETEYESSELIRRSAPQTLLETKAAVISHHYLQIMVVRKLHLWRHLALQAREYRAHIDRKACKMNGSALLRSGFQSWRTHLRSIRHDKRIQEAAQRAIDEVRIKAWDAERFREGIRQKAQEAERALAEAQQLAQESAQRAVEEALEKEEEAKRVREEGQRKEEELERDFAQLERRTVKFRDANIKAKAFSHWAQCAFEKVQVTSVAKRHMLRFRFLNAWKGLTVANEMHVRRMRLTKFFNIWKRRTAIHDTNTDVALQIYDDNLVYKTYLKWFQEHKVATFIRQTDHDLKRRALLSWAFVARTMGDDCRTAEDERHLNLAMNAWNTWKVGAERRVVQTADADHFYKVKTCLNALRKWRRETKFVPAKKIVHSDVNLRLLRQTFSTWLLHTREERQATEVDRSRMLREALTNWRLKVRCKRLQDIAKDRAIAKSFKTWRLAAKLAIAQRHKKQEVMYTYLEVWYDRFQDSRSKRWEREELARRHDNKITATLVLRQWYAGMYDTSEIDTLAADFHAPHALSRALVPWREKAAHTLQLQKYARDAAYYFLATKTLKRWRSSTEAAKREKRKVAYAQVRRITKINVARDMLSRWRSQTQQITGLKNQAQNFANNKAVIIGMNLFDQWRGRTEEMVEMESLWREVVMKKFFNIWKDRSWAFQALNIEAMLDFQERRQSRSVRKWSLRTIQMRASTSTATEVRDKNARKSFRKIFNYWRQRTTQLRPFLQVGTPPGTDTAENWSDFGDEDVDMDEITRRLHENERPALPVEPPPPLLPETPRPGYMATPSRRSGRVIAAATRFNSTTPRAPLSTPLERQLRAGYFSGSLPAFRRGRSTLGLDAGFPDIPEGRSND